MHRYALRLALATLACVPPALATSGVATPQAGSEPAGGGIVLTSDETSAAQAPAATPRKPRLHTVSLALSGDVLIHNNVWESAARSAGGGGARFDFRPMLAPIEPTISGADLAICHLEVPLAPPGGPYSSYPLFAAPAPIATALAWAGYDACSTASNHSVDQGFGGVARTLDVLDRVGLKHTGTARSKAEAADRTVFDKHGMRLAWLSYTFGTNGMPVDSDKPWSVNLIDVPRILRAAHAARTAGADGVIVALHWGDEYSHSPSAYQLDVAKQLTRSRDITLIYGHHAHVVQPIRKLNGTWVIFGLGNLLAGQGDTAPGVDNGIIARVTLRQRGNGRVRVLRPTYAATHIDYTDPLGEFRVYDVRRALSGGGLDPTTRAELLAARAQTAAVLR